MTINHGERYNYYNDKTIKPQMANLEKDYINQTPKKDKGMTTIMSFILYSLHYTPSI